MSTLTELQHALQHDAGPGPALKTGFAAQFIGETIALLEQLDAAELDRMATALSHVRDGGGRLFILADGASATEAREAATEFVDLCGFEAVAPGARQDDSRAEIGFAAWLEHGRIGSRDAVLVFCMAPAGSQSLNIVGAVETADAAGAHIFGIVGDGGCVREVAEACVVIPMVDRFMPRTEGICALLWRLLVSHPALPRPGGL